MPDEKFGRRSTRGGIVIGRFQDLSGMKFGRLQPLYRTDGYIDSQGRRRFKWVCRCDCGNVVEVRPDKLTSGSTQSCGCLQREIATKQGYMSRQHGCSSDTLRERIYNIWTSMKERCLNPNDDAYPDYGGRGVEVYARWMSFPDFLEWAVENGYKEDLTIDRTDVNGDYTPGNCRWATMKQQANNKRTNRRIADGGVVHTLSQWSDLTGIRAGTIASRLDRGWDTYDALTKTTKGGRHAG